MDNNNDISNDISPSILASSSAASAPTVRITITEVALLKRWFYRIAVETMAKEERKAMCKQVCREKPFSHLKPSQVMRVVVSYCGEINLRRGIGSLYEAVMVQMRAGGHSHRSFVLFAVIDRDL